MSLQAGQLFGNYCVVRLIGEGGFGEVYLVENQLIQRRAAVKVLHPALAHDPELVRRFLNEARAASAICHPNIVEVFDAGGTPDGAPYILMEFLEGVSLQKRLADRGRLAPPRVLDIAKQAGSALVAAHAAGIVHRDLKPENLFLVPDTRAPNGERVKVLDFGIAKIKHGGGSGGTVKTRTGMIIGSPAYMSPEQCKDSADVDARTDVYSFATILYEMLAGRTPHVAATGTELLFMHLTATPQPLRGLAPDVSPDVEAAIMRGLAKEREDRFENMESFVGALGDNWAASAPTRILPVEVRSPSGPSPVQGVKRKVELSGSTTFSRATGELAAGDESERVFLASTRTRRWPLIAVSTVVLLGGAMLLLLRPSRDSVPRPTADTGKVATRSAASTRPIAPVLEEALGKTEPGVQVALPSKPETIPQAEPHTVTEASPATKLPRAPSATAPAVAKRARQAPRQTTSPTTIKEWNSDERWLAH
jgi:serine/threonine-protein kinase